MSRTGQMRVEKLDVRGLVCPYPTLVTSQKISELSGDVLLEVICDKSESTLQSITTMLKKRNLRFKVYEKSDHYLLKILLNNTGG